MPFVVIETVGLFFAGILAGAELLVRYGVHPSLNSLDDRTHIQARVALVRILRVLVPSIMVPTVLWAIPVVVVGGFGPGFGFRWAGLAAYIAFVLFSFLGTVPINIRVIDWTADAPPSDWKAVVKRWERLDTFRSSAAILAFALFLVAAAY
jgi:Domain of unknown function (DUF1772)